MARPNKHKFYCSVDECGQDTAGRIFVVSIVVAGRESRDLLEKALEEIEQSSGKRAKKWQAAKFEQRLSYLAEVSQLHELQQHLFAAKYETSKEYDLLTTLTIAQAVNPAPQSHNRVPTTINALLIL